MGLDMYLTKKTYVSKYDGSRKRIRVIGVDGVKSSRVCYIEEDMGQWRKANAIHGWFVDNCQDGEEDCKPHYVDQSDMENLLVLVNKVLDKPKLAPKLLPVRDGFYFGDDKYDEAYFEYLKYTKVILEIALKEKGGEFYYQSSW